MKPTRLLLRLAGIGMVFSFIIAPSPGSVGAGCGGIATVQASQFCVDKKYFECLRDQAAGRIDATEFATCTTGLQTQCASAAWPAGCSPSQAEADACTELLRNVELLATPTPTLYQMYDDCNLCE